MGVALHLLLRGHRGATHADRRVAPRTPFNGRVPARRDQVLDASDDVEAVAALLRDPERPVQAGGVRLAEALLGDGDGPLYQGAEPRTLGRRVRVILEAMG